MRFLIVVGTLIIGGVFFLNQGESTPANKIWGASLVNPPSEVGPEQVGAIRQISAGWVAVIPYAFSRSGEGRVVYDQPNQWWGERTEGNATLIRFAQENQLKVMVKPHVWVGGEGWCGDYDLASEAAWAQWEREFSQYIIHHAQVADSLGASLFCIGTEYRIPARERPLFWRRLIKRVRAVYEGKLTYAANWDNYANISWWDQLDYIGVDAYFPLVEGPQPDISQIEEGWQPIQQELKAFSEKWDKPILFTEFGFQSADGAAGKHWEIDKTPAHVNNALQTDAYEATFRVFHDEKWWAGGFFWKWHLQSRGGRWRGTEWTPQGKPAEEVIKKWYSKGE